MIETIMAVLGGLLNAMVGLLAAIFGLGIGLTVLMTVLLPVMALFMIPLIPVLVVLVLLRAIGLVRGRFLTLVVFIALIFVMVGGTHVFWAQGLQSLRDWIDDSREVLDACTAQGGADIRLEFGGGPHFTCVLQKKQDTSANAHI